MRITSVTVTYSREITIPRHGTARLDVSLTAEAEPGDDIRSTEEIRAALEALWDEAHASVRTQGQTLLGQPATL
ncbi:MAG: hypothetical protein WCK70_04940 [Chloroflexales bacterium]